VFILLTTFMFLIASIYSFNQQNGKFFWLLMFLWQSALIGIFLTRDFFNVFVLIEVVTLVVAILIMFNRDNRAMYDGIIYLMVNIVVIKFYLLGVGYLYMLTGVLDFEVAATVLRESHPPSAMMLPYALIMTTVALKCALMPLFSWLPKAHGTPGAPPAVSALLSGVHIKSGVYLFIRFQDVFEPIAASQFFMVLGIVTGIAGFVLAMSQSDIKLILAYHTVSQVGLIMTGLNMPDPISQTGALYHVFNHAFFKGGLFLGAGLIIKAYGTRDVYKIRGVMKRYPIVGVATIMAILGITGAPLFNGMISKYFIAYGADWLLNGILIFMSLGTIVSFVKYSTMLTGNHDGEVVKMDANKQFAVLALGFLCLMGGIFGSQLVYFLFGVDARVDIFGYFQKVGIFAASLAAGYLIFKYYVSRAKIFKKIKAIDLSFRSICVAIGGVLAVILVAVYII
ncbi:MAG: proton-conducting membrane transporter, partial [Defluviitaleaceae bacterium]|nr:proton-conducting membrane transporter [Defluviitaleaceae bacterium]